MKKTISLKKVVLSVFCLMLVLTAGVLLTACGGTQENDYVTPGTNASFTGSDVKFNNSADFALVYKGDNHYEATGSCAKMDADQAKAWGTVEGSEYVVVNVKMGKNSTAIVGWRTVEDKDKEFLENEIDDENIKRSTSSNETKNFILALTDGETPRHENEQVWRIEVTPKAEEGETATKVVYTIDFSKLYVAE